MILGHSPIGATSLGSTSTVDALTTSWPTAVSVNVATNVPVMAAVAAIAAVTVQVAAAAPTQYAGGGSYPDAAAVYVRTWRIRAGLKSLPSAAAVTISAAAPITSVKAGVAQATIVVQAASSSSGIRYILPAVSVSVQGGNPVQAVAVESTPVAVSVTGVAPATGNTTELSSATVAVSVQPTSAGLSNTPDPAGVTVNVGAVESALRHIPLAALVWVSPGVFAGQPEATGGLVVVINANTLAVSEYDIVALDVIGHEDELYFISESALADLHTDGAETFVSTLRSGLLDYSTTADKRCPYVELVTGADEDPTVVIFNNEGTEYTAEIRAGYSGKHTRGYNGPRGMKSPRLGIVVEGMAIDVEGLQTDVPGVRTRQRV